MSAGAGIGINSNIKEVVLKHQNIALIEELERQNKELERGNQQLKHLLYHRKFITNPSSSNDREDG